MTWFLFEASKKRPGTSRAPLDRVFLTSGCTLYDLGHQRRTWSESSDVAITVLAPGRPWPALVPLSIVWQFDAVHAPFQGHMSLPEAESQIVRRRPALHRSG